MPHSHSHDYGQRLKSWVERGAIMTSVCDRIRSRHESRSSRQAWISFGRLKIITIKTIAFLFVVIVSARIRAYIYIELKLNWKQRIGYSCKNFISFSNRHPQSFLNRDRTQRYYVNIMELVILHQIGKRIQSNVTITDHCKSKVGMYLLVSKRVIHRVTIVARSHLIAFNRIKT